LIKLTYTDIELTKLARTLKKIGKNIKISYKTNNKLNNIISNNKEQYNNYNRRRFINSHAPNATNFM